MTIEYIYIYNICIIDKYRLTSIRIKNMVCIIYRNLCRERTIAVVFFWISVISLFVALVAMAMWAAGGKKLVYRLPTVSKTPVTSTSFARDSDSNRDDRNPSSTPVEAMSLLHNRPSSHASGEDLAAARKQRSTDNLARFSASSAANNGQAGSVHGSGSALGMHGSALGMHGSGSALVMHGSSSALRARVESVGEGNIPGQSSSDAVLPSLVQNSKETPAP
jgi:hypothetical protein